MKLFLAAALLLSFLSVDVARAHLTSDVDIATGYSNIQFQTAGNNVNMSTLATLDFNYNLNHAAWNSAVILNFTEATVSSQGPLAWTRLGLGLRYYLTGLAGQRVIFDNKVEGKYWRPAPFVGMTLGFSNFSVENIDGAAGYFNASTMDANLRAGAEVVLTTNFFLTGQLSILYGFPSNNSKTGKDLSYLGTGVYVGLKIISF